MTLIDFGDVNTTLQLPRRKMICLESSTTLEEEEVPRGQMAVCAPRQGLFHYPSGVHQS